MAKIAYENGAWSLEITPDDLGFITHIRALLGGRKEDEYLDYRISTSETHYANSRINWLEVTKGRERVRAPYDIVVDYRKRNENESWGNFKFIGKYEFPTILGEHRASMVERFKKEDRLAKGDNPAPRVAKFETINGEPFFSLQQAFYTDQVGTNLTLDISLPKPITTNAWNCTNVREWDIAQTNQEKILPEFEKSKLANTIGIAIGITAQSQNGRYVILRRKRAKNMAVYAGMWHVPFSFALAMSQFKGDERGEIKNLIRSDWGHEFSDELGLEFADFDPPQLLAFCRDLARGGKPQFFFEMKARLTFEELKKKLAKRTPEFTGNIEELKETKEAYSTELVAFTLLKSTSES